MLWVFSNTWHGLSERKPDMERKKPGKGKIHRIIYFKPEVQMSSVLKTLLLCTESANKEVVTFAVCSSTTAHLSVTSSGPVSRKHLSTIFPELKAAPGT